VYPTWQTPRHTPHCVPTNYDMWRPVRGDRAGQAVRLPRAEPLPVRCGSGPKLGADAGKGSHRSLRSARSNCFTGKTSSTVRVRRVRAMGVNELCEAWCGSTPKAKKYARQISLAPHGSTQDCGQMYALRPESPCSVEPSDLRRTWADGGHTRRCAGAPISSMTPRAWWWMAPAAKGTRRVPESVAYAGGCPVAAKPPTATSIHLCARRGGALYVPCSCPGAANTRLIPTLTARGTDGRGRAWWPYTCACMPCILSYNSCMIFCLPCMGVYMNRAFDLVGCAVCKCMGCYEVRSTC
jgi:hypothetical protein